MGRYRGFIWRPTYNMYMRCSQSPVAACRSMNMKVHQTLVWLNLLSFGTKDLAAPTIGIQSAANHFHKNVHSPTTHCSAILSLTHQRAHCPAVTELFRTVHRSSHTHNASPPSPPPPPPGRGRGVAGKPEFAAQYNK